MITARVAAPADAEAWRALRLDALRAYPSAFLTTYAEGAAASVADYAQRLEQENSFIVLDGSEAVGIAALIPLTQRFQTVHRGEIGAVYIAASHQGRGAAGALMTAIEAQAGALGIWQLELFVEARNTRAQSFYAKCGYVQAGRLPNAVVTPDGPADDLFLVKDLRRSG
ncbi:MAG: GNAT family N-acetyltransferase [Pseudomonadota bacterium]